MVPATEKAQVAVINQFVHQSGKVGVSDARLHGQHLEVAAPNASMVGAIPHQSMYAKAIKSGGRHAPLIDTQTRLTERFQQPQGIFGTSTPLMAAPFDSVPSRLIGQLA